MAQPDALDPRAVERAIEPAEATLLRLLLIYPAQFAATADRLTEHPFVTTPARELWKALDAALQEAGRDPTGHYSSGGDPFDPCRFRGRPGAHAGHRGQDPAGAHGPAARQ